MLRTYKRRIDKNEPRILTLDNEAPTLATLVLQTMHTKGMVYLTWTRKERKSSSKG